MVGYYPLCAFGENRVAASIDTALHAFLPFPHVDHLHPDWAIALAASANGKKKLEEFNKKYGRRIVWVPWQRPGFELALMLRKAVESTPGCDGIVLGGHGLFTWGATQHEAYLEQHQDDRSDGRVRAGPRETSRPAGLRRGHLDDCGRIGRRSSPVSCRTCAVPCRRTGASSRTTTAARTRSRSRTRSGPRRSASSARAARIISCARASRRSMCRFTRRPTACRR